MEAVNRSNWKEEFGLAGRNESDFVPTAASLVANGVSAPQSHALRRAFEQLKLHGVLCKEKSPLIYFRLVDHIVANDVAALHRLFWNQGVAPVLVLVAPDEVHVYSGLVPPQRSDDDSGAPAALVEKIKRLPEQLQRFLLAVETGEYFHKHRKSFNPERRVDRSLLRDLELTRKRLDQVPTSRLEPYTLNALLCRLVFTCYLFDRGVIDRQYVQQAGIASADHLRDILCATPRSQAKADLYLLFDQLGEHFNGDLFSENLEAEARQVRIEHLDILRDFFRGTDSHSGQQSFWPYEFGIIPIETISAIYEHFLKAAGEQQKKEAGAFYTPRFLAELVLDTSLADMPSLLNKRFLDPSCGSGIFLVGLFNRMVSEWDGQNPNAPYDVKLRALTALLTTSLFGIDRNKTACLIAAFSLYLALLDQLAPPAIRRALRNLKVKVLPRLVAERPGDGRPIRCADFFSSQSDLPHKVDLVIGNPPWTQIRTADAAAAQWVAKRKLPFPGKQLAVAFIWKAPEHLEAAGKVCFVLPHSLLFNHTPPAIAFQRQWVKQHAVEVLLNLADYQYFLFEEAKAPAIVARYAANKPADSGHRIEYWTPKTDWSVTQAEVITLHPQDRRRVTVREVLDDLSNQDAPLVWKERYWATERDGRLIERLRLYPRLRDLVGKRRDPEAKRWIIGEGFEPFGKNDKPKTRRSVQIADAARVEAGTHDLDLVLLREECDVQRVLTLDLRRAISDTKIFEAPLVLVAEGFSQGNSQIAYADFNVAYRHGIRGIHGPSNDRALLAFLTVYLRSAVARHFLFHTSSSWGISRARVDVDDLLRLPFPLPKDSGDQTRAAMIIKEVAAIMKTAAKDAGSAILGRDQIVALAQRKAEPLVEEYLDIDDVERTLIRDTEQVIIPSARPTRSRVDVPTIRHATPKQREAYVRALCDALNERAKSIYCVFGTEYTDDELGLGIVVLEKARRGAVPVGGSASVSKSVLNVLADLKRAAAKTYSTVELSRGLKVFDGELLYITKPLGLRFWTTTAALNDADEVESTIYRRSLRAGT